MKSPHTRRCLGSRHQAEGKPRLLGEARQVCADGLQLTAAATGRKHSRRRQPPLSANCGLCEATQGLPLCDSVQVPQPEPSMHQPPSGRVRPSAPSKGTRALWELGVREARAREHGTGARVSSPLRRASFHLQTAVGCGPAEAGAGRTGPGPFPRTRSVPRLGGKAAELALPCLRPSPRSPCPRGALSAATTQPCRTTRRDSALFCATQKGAYEGTGSAPPEPRGDKRLRESQLRGYDRIVRGRAQLLNSTKVRTARNRENGAPPAPAAAEDRPGPRRRK